VEKSYVAFIYAVIFSFDYFIFVKVDKEIAALLAIIENPYSEKGYIYLKKHFASLGMDKEYDAIQQLIQVRFNETTSSNDIGEQQEHGRKIDTINPTS